MSEDNVLGCANVHMVKSLTAILAAAVLLCGLGLFEWKFVEREFTGFREEVESLYDKADDGTASGEDAKAVQTSWETRKERLHVWIPHNDVARIDDYMSEAVRLVGEGEFVLAKAKLEIVLHLTGCLPSTYRPALENIL